MPNPTKQNEIKALLGAGCTQLETSRLAPFH